MTDDEIKHSIDEILSIIPRELTLGSNMTMATAAADGARSCEERFTVLRTQVRYFIFDLEACRRENALLRQMLENPPEETNDA